MAGEPQNAGFSDEVHAGHVERAQPVLARDPVLRAAFLEPSLVAKSELANHRWLEYLGVGDRGVDISKIILGAESREDARDVLASILKAEAAEDRVVVGKLVIDPAAEKLTVQFGRPAVEPVLEDIAVGIHEFPEHSEEA